MSTKLAFQRDVQGYNSFAPTPATDIQGASVTSASETHFTVPSNFQNWVAAFTYGANVFWVRVGGAAAAPGSATFVSTTSLFCPGSLSVQAGQEISVYNNGANTADVGVALYAIS